MDEQTTPPATLGPGPIAGATVTLDAADRSDAASGPQCAADGPLEVVESRGPDGYAFHFKVRASGQLYRIEPARDPRQPRFWCFRVRRCLKGGMVEPAELPWLGATGMTRDELDAASQAIREDINGWFAAAALSDLRDWVLSADAGNTASVSASL